MTARTNYFKEIQSSIKRCAWNLDLMNRELCLRRGKSWLKTLNTPTIKHKSQITHVVIDELNNNKPR